MSETNNIIERLASDEKFQAWVLHPTSELEQYWDNWLKRNPEQQESLQKARQIVRLMRIEKEMPPQGLKAAVWKNIHDDTLPQSRSVRLPIVQQLWKVAAVLILLAGLGYFYSSQLSTSNQYQTAYGETQTIHLPDHSIITLNANSSLYFSDDWEEKNVREVWLEGEAFFEIEQIPIADDSSGKRVPFIVHSHNMDVEVLGTTFNVKDREHYSEIVLNTGKVSVRPHQSQEIAPIAMQPGDWLTYSTENQEWKTQQVDPESYSSWRNQELIFDEMTIREITQILQETYGYQFSLEDEEIGEYEFTGKIKTDEIELLMPMLERSFSIEIQQDGNHYKFLKR